MDELRILATCCALMATALLSIAADDRIFCKSPDGKFALRTTFTDLVPSHGDAAIIETDTSKVAVQIHGDEAATSEKSVWSKDSRRAASFRDGENEGVTRVFFGTDRRSKKSNCPSCRPSPQLPTFQKQTRRIEKRSDVWNRFVGSTEAICFWKANCKTTPVRVLRFRSRSASNKADSQWFARASRRKCRS